MDGAERLCLVGHDFSFLLRVLKIFCGFWHDLLIPRKEPHHLIPAKKDTVIVMSDTCAEIIMNHIIVLRS